VPITLKFGTRPTLLVATALLFGSLIWTSLAQSFSSFEAARIISTFAVSAGEALPAIAVRDMFFLHERGWWMGAYMLSFQGVTYIGIILSGFVISGAGWRWNYWVRLLFQR
jgi:MFS family permease